MTVYGKLLCQSIQIRKILPRTRTHNAASPSLGDYRTKLSCLRKNILPTRDLPALLNGKYWTASDAERDEYINERGIQERERTLGCKTGMQMGRFRVQLSRACWAIFCRREWGSN